MKVALLFVLGLAATNAVELNGKNFESTIAGKAAFVKFLAPW